jgi:hypothetical protein
MHSVGCPERTHEVMPLELDDQPYTVLESLELLLAWIGDFAFYIFEYLEWLQQYLLHGQVRYKGATVDCLGKGSAKPRGFFNTGVL